MMVYIRNPAYICKLEEMEKKNWSQESPEQVWRVFGGPSGIVVGSVVSVVSVVVDSARSERMRATSGKSSRMETLYVTQRQDLGSDSIHFQMHVY